MQIVAVKNVGTKEDDGAPKGSDATTETVPSEKSDNIVLQKLLGKDCFICKKGGHRPKECPEKSSWGSQSTKICLNCGDFGHEMFSCKNTYSPDDLKEVQCYVCKCFGHFCCVNCAAEGSSEFLVTDVASWAIRECAKVYAETGSKWTPSSCYVCGQESHTACKCTAFPKKVKRKRDPLTPKKEKKKKKKKQKDSVDKYGNDLGAISMLPQPNPRGRGSCVTEQPHVYNHNHKYNLNHNQGWGSPMAPPMYISNDRFQFHGGNGYQFSNDRFQFHGGSGYNSGYNSLGFLSNPGMFHAAGYNGYQHRFSASKFGNSSYGRGEHGWGS